jgi:hypothetical protein
MSYLDVRAWMEQWMEGASIGWSVTGSGSAMTTQQRRREQQRRTDPRQQDLAPPGTPNGLGDEYELSVSTAYLNGCELETYPGPWILGLGLVDPTAVPARSGVDSITVQGDAMVVYGIRWSPPTGARPWVAWAYRSPFSFTSEDHAKQAKLVWERAIVLCRETVG